MVFPPKGKVARSNRAGVTRIKGLGELQVPRLLRFGQRYDGTVSLCTDVAPLVERPTSRNIRPVPLRP